MTTIVEALRRIKAPRVYYLIAFASVLVLFAITRSSRVQEAKDAEFRPSAAPIAALPIDIAGRAYAPVAPAPQSYRILDKQGIVESQALAPQGSGDGAANRTIVRNASIEMIVQHPSAIADQITTLAEKLGGYLVNADGTGQKGTHASVTVRVPVAHFEEARAEIRELGLRVENEKFDAQDVTQQYVDQAASIRNLQAQEWQYLEILKQARDMSSMVLVTDRLTEVRAKIEKQQAEFNSLAHQAETVAIAISLRTEQEQQVFGLEWRPLYELKVAASNGLESLATHATAMMTILFYLPAVLLWVGTIGGVLVGGERALRWARRRWFGWKPAEAPAQPNTA
jgi:Domain of unknown function (DUF4349)